MDYDERREKGFQPKPDRHKVLLSLVCQYGHCNVSNSWNFKIELLLSVIYELNASKIFANLSVWVGVYCSYRKTFNFVQYQMFGVICWPIIILAWWMFGFTSMVLMTLCCNVLSRHGHWLNEYPMYGGLLHHSSLYELFTFHMISFGTISFQLLLWCTLCECNLPLRLVLFLVAIIFPD